MEKKYRTEKKYIMITAYFIGCIFSFIFCILGLICELKQELKYRSVNVTIGDIFTAIFRLICVALLSWGIIILFLYCNRDREILYFKKNNYDKD